MAKLILFGLCLLAVIVSGKKFNRWKADVFDDTDIMDVTDFSVYYDVQTNETIRRMLPRPWYTPGWLLRLPFFGGPCKCEVFRCTCCAGMKIPNSKSNINSNSNNKMEFDKKACTILTYEPVNSTLNMEVTMNGDGIYKNIFSARNPPPFCIPIPIPYLPPGYVDMCIRLFDITVVDQRLHVCMDWDTRIDRAPVLVLHYDCMDMGFDGVSLSKPGGSSNQTNSTPAESTSGTPSLEPEQVDSDVYDTVHEKVPLTTQYPFNNSIKYI